MIRLIHAQKSLSTLLVDDIDDGLPNKQAVWLGGKGADPKSFYRGGYANEPKQQVYVPYTDATNSSLPGYIDLNETQRVILSQDKGKIAGLVKAGEITVMSLVAADKSAPNIAGVNLGAPAAGDVTISGTNFLSVSPQVTSVRLFGAGVGDVTLTSTQIVAVAPGAATETSLIIDSTLITGLATGDDVTVTADGQASNTFAVP